MSLYEDARLIMKEALASALPDNAVQKALNELRLDNDGKTVLIAIGKAAWQMAKAALSVLGDKVHAGVVITKHGHSMGDLPHVRVFEAGHPVPDEDTITATGAALQAVRGLTEKDMVLFLISGGGSALFEQPKVNLDELKDITGQLLAAGCDIVETNTIRKRLSNVKGGRFAQLCAPARVFSIVLSDIVGDPLDMIASGPAYPDSSTKEDALQIIKRYRLNLSPETLTAMEEETPKALSNVTTKITGSVRQLCDSAADTAKRLGYKPFILTASLRSVAKEVGAFLGAMAEYHQQSEKSLAFICGGETVVHLVGNGLGGRNQEIALAAVPYLSSCKDTCLFSLGSDGTDGPTDAAGGYVDDRTSSRFEEIGLDNRAMLDNNDAYHALKAVDGLIMTGPTGTNVNDVTVLLIKR
ncbi:MAG: glycerate kinase type-2 family protein [Christensenellales bacterium]|jgi:glycerate 2-kinase